MPTASTAADTGADDPQTSANMRNWMVRVCSRETPNAPIEAGCSHSIALCMNVAAIRTGQKVTFDDKTEQVLAGARCMRNLRKLNVIKPRPSHREFREL